MDPYNTAVQKFNLNVLEMMKTLPDPSMWQSIKDNKEAVELFVLAFKDAAEQLNLVEQYYEYKWEDASFGIDEHTWLKYVGAYRNLVKKENQDPIPGVIKSLVGKTKLAGTQVIDATHILGLIGSKVSNVDGIQSVDGETLRIIYEQIQELSDMGDDAKAHLLREFVDTELLPGKLEYGVSFDDAFDSWKGNKLKAETDLIAGQWGIDNNWLLNGANELYNKAIIYNDIYQKEILDIFEEEVLSTIKNKEELKTNIFGEKIKEEELINISLSKMRKDILKQLNIYKT